MLQRGQKIMLKYRVPRAQWHRIALAIQFSYMNTDWAS